MFFSNKVTLFVLTIFLHSTLQQQPPPPTPIMAKLAPRYSGYPGTPNGPTPIVSRKATCDDEQFHFYIEFAAPFGGKIYARNTPECTYVNADIPGQGFDQASGVVQKLFNISLPLSTNCGSERREANDYQEYSIRLNVDPQPSADGTQGFILVCRKRKPGDGIVQRPPNGYPTAPTPGYHQPTGLPNYTPGGPSGYTGGTRATPGYYGATSPPSATIGYPSGQTYGTTAHSGYAQAPSGPGEGIPYVSQVPVPQYIPTYAPSPGPSSPSLITGGYGATPGGPVYQQPPRSDSSFHLTPPREENLQHTVNLDATSTVQFDSRIVFGESPNGPTVTRTVELGERLTYVFRCSTNDGAARDCGVGVCFAKGETGNTVQLTDANGCSLHSQFWTSFKRDNTYQGQGSQYSASFWAWGLHSDVNLVISCALQVCAQQCIVGQNCFAHSHDESPRGPDYTPGPPSDNGQIRPLTLQQLHASARRLKDDSLVEEEEHEASEFITRSELSLQNAALYEVDSPAARKYRSLPPTRQAVSTTEDCVESSTLIVMATAWLATLVAPIAVAGWLYGKLNRLQQSKG